MWQPILQSEGPHEYCANDDSSARDVLVVIYDVVDYTSDTCLDHFKLAGGVNAAEHAHFAEGRILHATKDIISTNLELFEQQRYRQWSMGYIALKADKSFGIGGKMLPRLALTAIAVQNLPDISSDSRTWSLQAIDYYRPWKTLRQHFDHTGRVAAWELICLTVISCRKRSTLRPHVHWAAYGRRFITTKNQHFIGMCHSAGRAGDSVVLLRGARTPFVLRKAKVRSVNGKTQWRMLGEAYVHGLRLRTDAGEEQQAAQ